MATKGTSKVIPGPHSYKVEEVGSYVDAVTPVVDVSNLI